LQRWPSLKIVGEMSGADSFSRYAWPANLPRNVTMLGQDSGRESIGRAEKICVVTDTGMRISCGELVVELLDPSK